MILLTIVDAFHKFLLLTFYIIIALSAVGILWIAAGVADTLTRTYGLIAKGIKNA